MPTCSLRTTHMPYVPRGYHDLAGAIRLFHATFKCELEGDADHDEGEVVATRVTPKITAAIRYTFVRDEFDDQQWRGALLPSTATWPRLTAGCRYDPIDALTLIAEWPPMPVDNLANMEQLRPADAALWFVRGDTEVHDGNPGALPGMAMSRCLERMMWCMADGTPSTLASLRDRGYANGVSMVDRVDVDMLVDRLFANQQNDHGDMESDVSDMRDPAAMEDPIFVVPTPAELAAQFRHSASTPYRGFIWRLALEIAHLLQGMPSHDHLIPAVRPLLSVVWLEIIRELRYRWTYKKWTPNVVTRVVVEAGDSVAAGIGRRTVVKGDSALNGVSVDTRHALIVQKLSMLNACVYRHHRRGTGGNARLSNADVAKVMDVEDRRERRRRREDLESVSAATEEVVSDDAPSVNATRVKMTQEGVGHAENIAHDLLKDDWKWDDEDEEQGKEEQVASRKVAIVCLQAHSWNASILIHISLDYHRFGCLIRRLL